jgi:hypothetical protein
LRWVSTLQRADAAARHERAEAVGSWDPPPLDVPYGLLTFGAQFARVAVDADLGIVRVRHLVGAFAPGRCERWPLAGLGRLRSGIAALALAWGVGIGAYFLFVNLNAVPAAARAAAGLRNPGGPIPGPDFGSALIAVGVWQAVFFIVLRGWPVNTISQQARRLIAGNALVIGLGAATYLVLRDGAGLQSGTISAVCGSIISAAIIVGMLFEGWPAARLSPGPGRALAVVLTAAVAVVLNRALAAYADGVLWVRATPDDWVTTAALSFIGAGIILHVGIGLRWPFATKTKEN